VPELQDQLRRAIELAAEYELLGSLAGDEKKRAEARKLAAFHKGVAEQLRMELANQRYQPPHESQTGANPR
jgi:hypothetical protein